MEWMMDGKTIHLARDLEAMASFVCSCFGKRMSSANQGEIDGNRPGIASWQPGSVCTSLPFPPTEPTVPWRGQYLLWLLDGLDIWYFTDSKCSGMLWSHQSEGFFLLSFLDVLFQIFLGWCGVTFCFFLRLLQELGNPTRPRKTKRSSGVLLKGTTNDNNRYYELNERYWNESVAQALRDREETNEELLQKFSDFMKKHGYEKKILGNGPGCSAMWCR